MQDDLHIRGTRIWLQDLRESCERNFYNPEEGRRWVRQIQIEWTDAHSEGEVDDALHEGLERRALRSLRASADEGVTWLDVDDLW